jgi:DNA-binding MarR family transcriptional regulator
MVTRKAVTRAKPADRSKAVGSARVRNTRRSATVGKRAAKAPKPVRTVHRPLAMAVLEQFRLIFRSAKRHFQWVQERTGVSGAQLWVLAELRRKPGMGMTELAQAMAVHQSTASNLIDRLAKSGLIQRDRSGEDRRVAHLSLTSAGHQTLARAPLPLEGVLPDALNSLDDAELVELQQRLEKLASLMKVRDRAGKRIPLAEM